MTNLKTKLIALMTVLIGIIMIKTSVLATNENIEVLQKSSGDYLIYIKDNSNTDFEFAFSNNKSENKETLIYTVAETDGTGADANKVAYVNSTTIALFSNPTYMWARVGGNYIAEGVQVDLAKAMHEYNLQHAADITKIIEVDTTQTNITKQTINDKEITKIVGKVVLTDMDKDLDYSYILVKLPKSDEYNNLINLATRISKFNSNTDMYTKINLYKQFLEAFNNLIPNYDDNWVDLEGNEISQPEDAEDGEQYVLWIKEGIGERAIRVDIQILTSHKQYSEEKIKEQITTKSPITYDNNILLIVLAILVVSILVVSIRIKSLNKKQEK